MMGAGVMITCKNRVLLLKRSKDHKWNCAGGSTEIGESRFQTAIREMNEEIVNVPETLKIVDHHNTKTYTLFYGILEEPFTPEINEESIDWAWVSISEVFDLEIHPKDYRSLKYFLA